MNIAVDDTALEARIQKQIQAIEAASAEEALLRLLETQEEQERWLLENKSAMNNSLRFGAHWRSTAGLSRATAPLPRTSKIQDYGTASPTGWHLFQQASWAHERSLVERSPWQ
jgi:hypothetical protein